MAPGTQACHLSKTPFKSQETYGTPFKRQETYGTVLFRAPAVFVFQRVHTRSFPRPIYIYFLSSPHSPAPCCLAIPHHRAQPLKVRRVVAELLHGHSVDDPALSRWFQRGGRGGGEGKRRRKGKRGANPWRASSQRAGPLYHNYCFVPCREGRGGGGGVG